MTSVFSHPLCVERGRATSCELLRSHARPHGAQWHLLLPFFERVEQREALCERAQAAACAPGSPASVFYLVHILLLLVQVVVQ